MLPRPVWILSCTMRLTAAGVQPSTSEQSPLLPHEGQPSGCHDGGANSDKSRRRARLRQVGLFAWALVATAAVIVMAAWVQHKHQTADSSPPVDKRSLISLVSNAIGGSALLSLTSSFRRHVDGQHNHQAVNKRNLIFMISDGMGPASLSLTRSFRQHVESLPEDNVLVLDRHFWGSSRTRSSSSLVTDSAAGATAFACGKKSYNGAISVTPDYKPCGSVLEAAKKAGYRTGLVVTTDITDATPACFASHVRLRQMQDQIALQEIGQGLLGRSVDLMLGGGRCHFLPNGTSDSCRMDHVDVVALAQEKYGWTYIDNRRGFDALKGGENAQLPLLGLFASTDVPFELDRRTADDIYPSLSEMAVIALRALERATSASDKGFFLMVEGSRIDHAGHINDPAAQVHEVLEYDKTFKAVLDFIADSKTESVLVATSDHETGGLTTAIQEPGHFPVYNWYPQVLANASASCEKLAAMLQDRVSQKPSHALDEGLKAWVNDKLVVAGLGITDATDKELTLLTSNPEVSINTFAAMISLRAHVGWSTHGHTAVDVNIYSSGGPATDRIRGNVENTDVGKFLGHYLDVDVDEVTRELQERTKRPGPEDSTANGASVQWSNDHHIYEDL